MTAQPSGQRIAAVVVTYRRPELLHDSLTAIEAQSRRPDVILVVDNASEDGTSQMVEREHPDVDLLTLPVNVGGAGGFAAGLQRALEHHRVDLVWLMDDDTVPTPTALQELEAAQGVPARPALVASRVQWTDGRDHPMNTPRRRPGVRGEDARAAADAGCYPVRSASFVSILVEGDAVREVGLPVADYFLWNDDFEFTTRLLRRRAGWLCPSSVVEHRTKAFGGSGTDPGERFYYEVRNKLWMLRTSNGLGPLEKLLYGGATLLRWAGTIRDAKDRRLTLAAGRRGLRDGLTRRPRPNERVLPEGVRG